MSVKKIIKRSIFFNEITHFCFAWLMLFCICLCSIPISGQINAKSSELVFCPLQKKWVAKNDSQLLEIKPKLPLEEICSSNQKKENFVFELSKNIVSKQIISNAKDEENLFFKYLEKGNQSFAAILNSHNIPERSFAKLISAEKTNSNNFNTDFAQILTEISVPTQFPRPPTFQNINVFDRQISRKLNTISRQLAPRAPPIFS